MSDTPSSSKNTLPSSLWLTLGLAGAVSSTVSCGPCLKVAAPDTAEDTGDTGDTEDTQQRRSAAPAAGGGRSDAARRVLERGVLPEDVAQQLRARLPDPPVPTE